MKRKLIYTLMACTFAIATAAFAPKAHAAQNAYLYVGGASTSSTPAPPAWWEELAYLIFG